MQGLENAQGPAAECTGTGDAPFQTLESLTPADIKRIIDSGDDLPTMRFPLSEASFTSPSIKSGRQGTYEDDAASCGSAGPANSFVENMNSQKDPGSLDNQLESRKAISRKGRDTGGSNPKTKKTGSPPRASKDSQVQDKERLVRKRSVEKKKENTKTHEAANGKIKAKKSRASRESDKKGKLSQVRVRDTSAAEDQSESQTSLEEDPYAKAERMPFPSESNLRVIKESLSQNSQDSTKAASISLNDETEDCATSSRAKTAHKKKSLKKKKHDHKKRAEGISLGEEASFEVHPHSNLTAQAPEALRQTVVVEEQQVDSAKQPQEKEKSHQQRSLDISPSDELPKRATLVVQQSKMFARTAAAQLGFSKSRTMWAVATAASLAAVNESKAELMLASHPEDSKKPVECEDSEQSFEYPEARKVSSTALRKEQGRTDDSSQISDDIQDDEDSVVQYQSSRDIEDATAQTSSNSSSSGDDYEMRIGQRRGRVAKNEAQSEPALSISSGCFGQEFEEGPEQDRYAHYRASSVVPANFEEKRRAPKPLQDARKMFQDLMPYEKKTNSVSNYSTSAALRRQRYDQKRLPPTTLPSRPFLTSPVSGFWEDNVLEKTLKVPLQYVYKRITEDAGSFFKELFTPRSDCSKKRNSPEKKLRIGFRPMSSFRGKPENSDGTDSSSVSDIDDDFVTISKWIDGGEYGGKTREIRRKRIIANRVGGSERKIETIHIQHYYVPESMNVDRLWFEVITLTPRSKVSTWQIYSCNDLSNQAEQKYTFTASKDSNSQCWCTVSCGISSRSRFFGCGGSRPLRNVFEKYKTEVPAAARRMLDQLNYVPTELDPEPILCDTGRVATYSDDVWLNV